MITLLKEQVIEIISKWPPAPPDRKTAMEVVCYALGDVNIHLRRRNEQTKLLARLLLQYGRPRYSCFRGILPNGGPCTCAVCYAIAEIEKDMPKLLADIL